MRYDDFDLEDGSYELPRGERSTAGTLYVWTQAGAQWGCRAYDHGPFCRRAVRLDGIAAACIANVIEGVMELIDDPSKGWLFWVSPTGRAKVETAIRRGGFAKGLDA